MRFVPKEVPEEDWRFLEPARDFAIRSKKDDVVYLRFGPRLGMVLMLSWTANGRMLQTIDFETGEATPLKKLPESGENFRIGRTSECDLKITSPLISRIHLVMSFNDDIVVMSDPGSTNRTYVFKDTKHFDIGSYIESHPLGKAEESTLDSVHESFGPTLDDFLKTYSQKKENPQ